MIDIQDIKKLQLNKNDTLVLKLDEMPGWEFDKKASHAYQYLRSLYKDNKILILDSKTTLAVLEEKTI